MKREMELYTNRLSLIVQYYRCSKTERQAEIDTCLRNNLFNPYLSAIHLLTEELFDVSLFPNNEKIVQTVIGERLTFERAFKYANESDPDGRNVWIVSNADIYFDESLQLLADVTFENMVFALTRHDIQKDGAIKLVDAAFAHGCQDAWIFKTPVPLDRMFTAFSLGIPGCDNRIAYELIVAGYKVINPALALYARHLDLTRDVNIYERDRAYAEMMTEEGLRSGRAVPPPYQYHLYPVDQLDPDSVAMYQSYMGNMADLGRRVMLQEAEKLEQSRQIEKLGGLLEGAYRQLQELNREIREQRAQFEHTIAALYDSLSWKITKPLRYMNSFVRRNKQ